MTNQGEADAHERARRRRCRIRCDDQELIIHGYRLASATAASTSGSPTIIGTLALPRQAR
jgi:hypothetical protein